jgi:hypothetical protein
MVIPRGLEPLLTLLYFFFVFVVEEDDDVAMGIAPTLANGISGGRVCGIMGFRPLSLVSSSRECVMREKECENR